MVHSFGRQCGEAIRIKEIDPKKRINNKEEYHQPGDVDVIYAKNGLIEEDRKQKRQNTKDNRKPNSEEKIKDKSIEKSDENQKTITGYFTKKIINQREDENVNDEDPILNTQEFINDARERRKVRKNSQSCAQCDYTTTSKTMLERHVSATHEQNRDQCAQCDYTATSKDVLIQHMSDQHSQIMEDSIKEMRVRFACDICQYRTTSEAVLQQHKILNHERKRNSKRKICEHCNKQFNKDETLKKHMKVYHEPKEVKQKKQIITEI